MCPHTVLNPAVPYWNWIALGFGWRSDDRRSSLTFRGIAEATGDKGFGRVTERGEREKSTGGYSLRASGCRAVSVNSVDKTNCPIL